jgi:hypothetical protein
MHDANSSIPPYPDRRPIENRPRGQGESRARHGEGSTSSRPDHDTPVANSARKYPRLALEPMPQWPSPSVTTSTHAAPPRPGARLAEIVPLPAPPEPPLPPPRLVDNFARLRALITKELALLTRTDDAAATTKTPARTPVARTGMGVPLALPAGPPAATVDPPAPTPIRRRTPKPVREGAGDHRLTPNMAAAISRLTGVATTSEVRPPTGIRRGRIILVPLAEPMLPEVSIAPVTPAPTRSLVVPTPPIDLRDATRAKRRTRVAHPCPACGKPGVVDVIDQVSNVVGASCRSCSHMWQSPLNERSTTETH